MSKEFADCAHSTFNLLRHTHTGVTTLHGEEKYVSEETYDVFSHVSSDAPKEFALTVLVFTCYSSCLSI